MANVNIKALLGLTLPGEGLMMKAMELAAVVRETQSEEIQQGWDTIFLKWGLRADRWFDELDKQLGLPPIKLPKKVVRIRPPKAPPKELQQKPPRKRKKAA